MAGHAIRSYALCNSFKFKRWKERWNIITLWTRSMRNCWTVETILFTNARVTSTVDLQKTRIIVLWSIDSIHIHTRCECLAYDNFICICICVRCLDDTDKNEHIVQWILFIHFTFYAFQPSIFVSFENGKIWSQSVLSNQKKLDKNKMNGMHSSVVCSLLFDLLTVIWHLGM